MESAMWDACGLGGLLCVVGKAASVCSAARQVQWLVRLMQGST